MLFHIKFVLSCPHTQNLDEPNRMIYEAAAALEMKQYRHDLERWQLKQKLKKELGAVSLTKTAATKLDHDGEVVKGGKTDEQSNSGAIPSAQLKSIQGQDFSAQPATCQAARGLAMCTTFAPAFNPSIQMDFTPLPHSSLPMASSAGTSLYHPFQRDELTSAAAAAAVSVSTTEANTNANIDSVPVRKSSSASNLSFLVEAGLLPASIMDEDCGGFFGPEIPPETQQELRAKATNMPNVFDDDIVDFLASPDYGLPSDPSQQEQGVQARAQADPYPIINLPNDFAAFSGAPQGEEVSAAPAAGEVTYEKPPSRSGHSQDGHEESKANTANQRMVPVPDGQKVPFTARTA